MNKVNGLEWMEDLIGLEGSYVMGLVIKVIKNKTIENKSKNKVRIVI